MKCYFATLAALSFLLSGCASTRMTSQANPETLGRSFGNVLVLASFQNLEHRQFAEEKLCTELIRIAGPGCQKSYGVFFPGEEHSSEEISSRLSELEIDAVLVMRETASGVSSAYLPPTFFTTGSATVVGNTVIGSSTTTTSGGHYKSSPWASYEAVLYSMPDGKVTWYATATSSEHILAPVEPEWNDLITSASRTTVSKLVSDGVFRKLEPSK